MTRKTECVGEKENDDGKTRREEKVRERERSSLHRVILSMHDEKERESVLCERANDDGETKRKDKVREREREVHCIE